MLTKKSLKAYGKINLYLKVIKKQDATASKNLILSINKLINPKVMGNTFHALAFSNKNCKFNLGFI